MGGWAQKNIVVTPAGRVLPCHASAEIKELEFWSVPERTLTECWRDAPGMNAYRGEDWMPEPCRSCPERVRDFGGCRCQAYALTKNPVAVDPACSLSPDHGIVLNARRTAEGSTQPTYIYRGSNPTPADTKHS
jgi:pyrroloquinoline quinone biosynthesis protein E